jgi:uncharacterized YceG family protein
VSRSADEREAARIERERQRALRRGEAPPEPPAPDPEPPAPEPTAADHAANGHQTLPPAPAPEADGAWAWDQPQAEPEPDPQPAAPIRSFPSAKPPDWHPDDEPIGTISAPQPGAPGMSPHRPVTVPRRRRRPGRMLLIVVPLLVLAIAIGWAAWSTFTPLEGDGEGEVVVTIPAGSSTREIGDLLADKGVVGSGFFFALRAGIGGDDLRAGRFTLARDMGNAEAIDVLTRVPAAPKLIRLTLPEGPSRREMAERVASAGVEGDYVAATRKSPRLNPRDYGAPKGASLEGFLFPATYELRSGATARSLVAQQVEAFKDNFATVGLKYAKRKNLTRYDVLTIASMIERETAVPRERRLIAAVIYNRLHERMPLQIDATTRYAVNNWTRPLTSSELASGSAYNTRNRQGLPPTPIGNPGLASLKAAARPANVNYLYYVVKPCGNGAHAFSRSEAKFQENVEAYNRKREELGGKDPSQC